MVRWRLRFLQLLLVAAFLPLLGRLAWLQLEPATHAEYVRRSQHRIRRLLPPRRGQILARDGTVLVRNQPVFQIQFIPGALDPRREPLAILGEELGRRDGFPPPVEIEARLLELCAAARREPPPPDAPPGAADWILLLEGLDARTARILNTRWQACAGVLEARPSATNSLHGVWLHAGRALTLERTLERLQALLVRHGTPGDTAAAALEARVRDAFEKIELRVARETAPDVADNVSPDRVAAKARLCRRRYYESSSFVLVAEVPVEVITEIEYLPEDFPGLRCHDGVRREYPLGEACGALLGALRRVDTDEKLFDRLTEEGKVIDALPFLGAEDFASERQGGLCGADLVGDSGLERRYDEELRGLYGMSLVSISRRGEPLEVLEEVPPVHGKDLPTTLDAALQLALYRALEQQLEPAAAQGAGTAGSAVVLDLETGGLLASVGFPGFDPGRLMRDREYLTVLEKRWKGQTRSWLVDRPSLVALYPGSVFKLVMAAAALEGEPPLDEPLSPDLRIPCTHSFGPIPSMHCSGDHGHTPSGTVDLMEALQFSCNLYFYSLAHDHLAPATILAWSRRLGYGEPTGIDLPEHVWERGVLPSPDTIQGERQACQMAIGQDPIQATPLQVLRSVAALALGTGVPRPHLATASAPAPLSLRNPRTIAAIHDGMSRVAHAPGGTAWHERMGLRGYDVALKTGTAELRKVPTALHNGWLVGFAPRQRPRIAFVVVVERTALHGGDAAAPVVKLILDHLERQAPGAYRLEAVEPPQ